MSLISNILSGVLGYGVAELSSSHALRDLLDQKINHHLANTDLREIIQDVARARGIYTSDNRLARELHDIAISYEEYDYDRIY